MEEEKKEMPFWEHLEELRWRIIKWLLFFAVSFVVAFIFQDELMWVVTLPHRTSSKAIQTKEQIKDYASILERIAEKKKNDDPELSEALFTIRDELEKRDPSKLVLLKYEESFVAYLKVSLAAAFLVSLPFGVYQLWRFVSAGLYPSERKTIGTFIPFSLLLFAAGLLFGYFLLIPIGLRFLLSYGDSQMFFPSITLGFYLSFFITIMLSLGVVFQLPLVMLILAAVGIITLEWLRKARRFFIVGAFIIAAIFTPPDCVTQILLAIPLLLLFEVGIILIKILVREQK
ncbi:MAG: twin-arginine translocase subunit TatC [Planctomycetota bacterium]|nr:twin-arginine translocase subunit TatC [Planctomycetota bacterium]